MTDEAKNRQRSEKTARKSMNEQVQERNAIIIRYSAVGVAMNLVLSIGKLIAGTIFRSHAVMLDGFNSLSDLISQVFTIVFARFGMQSADREHPFGYGRLEYVSSLIVTAFIIYVGVKSIIDSIFTILHPDEPPVYSPVLISIMIVSLIAKLAYGLLMRKNGRRIGSVAMIMTGIESMGDSLIAVAVLVSFVVFRFTGVDIEHYLCILISLMIINTGIAMVRDSMRKILGGRADPELRKRLSRMIATQTDVMSVSNVVIHNYGEGVNIASVDIDVNELMRVSELNAITRHIKREAEKEGVIITSVGVNGVNLDSVEAVIIWDTIIDMIMRHKSVAKAQSFSVDFNAKTISFSIVENQSMRNREQDMKELRSELNEAFPDMKVEIDIAHEN